MFERANAHFETLWNDPEFVAYDPTNESQRNALRAALQYERRGTSGMPLDVPESLAFFDLLPKTYQAEMLEDLAAERLRGRLRNLLVAATGTGKTMVAAFDYRRICHEIGGRPRLLFVAHRLEILLQSLRTYREVLRDNSFGEILAEGRTPTSQEHLFATIQSVTSRKLIQSMGAEYWHTVVIDECHRLAADSFDMFARSINPKILLGLTATPERSDGQPIFSYFDNRPDGSPAVELRLWTALDLQLLAPFEYYGCDDETDFSEIPWDRAGETQALDKLLTGNHVRAHLVTNEWRRLSGNPRGTKALVFCVSVSHALFMAEAFNKAGLPSQCLVGNTDAETRRQAPKRLARGEICAIVTCDLYNEGIDIPEVDTILLLRPTQSPVLFQQQIGRGLRLSPGKESCLVLDFAGRFRIDFRIDILYRALTGLSRSEIEEAVDKGFNRLPAGCHFHLDRQPRERILANLRAAANQTWPRLKSEVLAYAASRGRANLTLKNFITDQKLELSDIYRDSGHSGWTALLRESSLLETKPEAEDVYFGRRFESLLHIDDNLRVASILHVAESGAAYQTTSSSDDLRMQMLAYQVDGGKEHIGNWRQFAERLDARPEMKSELAQLGAILEEEVRLPPKSILGIEDTPLVLHASYSSREILTALGWLTAVKKPPFQAGVLSLTERKCELLFVTLDKREGYHAGIAYKDYAVSPSLFHWQSQNSAGPDTSSGRRYIESEVNGWQYQLFVRESRKDHYKACGPCSLENWKGDRPMSIVWRLSIPLPPTLYSSFSILRDA